MRSARDVQLGSRGADGPGPGAQDTGLRTDAGLRAALSRLADSGFASDPDWEQIGTLVLGLAAREAQEWPSNRSEYASAFTAAVIELFRRRTAVTISAESPWGLARVTGRRAAASAVGAERSCGLTDRDPVLHRVRYANTPRIVGWCESGPSSGLRTER